MNTRNDYKKLIRDHFPEVEFKKVRTTGGWDNAVLILDDEYVFRFPKKKKYHEIFIREVKLLQHLSKRVDIAIPKYEFLVLKGEQPFGGYRLIKGKEMRQHAFRRLSDSQKSKIVKQLGLFLTELHRTSLSKVAHFGFPNQRGEGGWWDVPHAKSIYKRIKTRVYPRLTTSEREWVTTQFETYLKLAPPKQNVFIHNDLTDDHIFFDAKKGNITGIIDFADAEIGDPALDFAGLWRYGAAFVNEVFKEYKGEKDPDMLARSKFPLRVNNIANMLEVIEGGPDAPPVSYETSYKKLQAKIASGFSM